MEKLFRKIRIEIEHDMFILFPCVYRLQIGECFYIGRTKNIHKRMSQHAANINALMPLWGQVRNVGGTPYQRRLYRLYGRSVRYIHEHGELQILHAKLLEHFTSIEQMCARENALLRHYLGHKDCINKLYRASILTDHPNEEA